MKEQGIVYLPAASSSVQPDGEGLERRTSTGSQEAKREHPIYNLLVIWAQLDSSKASFGFAIISPSQNATPVLRWDDLNFGDSPDFWGFWCLGRLIPILFLTSSLLHLWP